MQKETGYREMCADYVIGLITIKLQSCDQVIQQN